MNDTEFIFVIVAVIIAVITLVVLFVIGTASKVEKPYRDYTEYIENKGERGEAIVHEMLRNIIELHGGYAYRQLALEDEYGNWSEIDNILISNIGVYIIETKNLSGSIIGRGSENEWIQITGTKTIKFQNPLIQNHRHIKFFKRVIPNSGYVDSMAIFVNSDISSVVCSEVFDLLSAEDYLSKKHQKLPDSKVEYINNQVKKFAENPPFTHEQYVRWMRKEFKNKK